MANEAGVGGEAANVAVDAIGLKLREVRAAVELLPNCRSKSVVLTKLDEARLWLEPIADGTGPLGGPV